MCYNKDSETKTKTKTEKGEVINMTIIRTDKYNYIVKTRFGYEFSVIKRDFSEYWYVSNDDMKIGRLCEDLAEAFDYIEFIMLI